MCKSIAVVCLQIELCIQIEVSCNYCQGQQGIVVFENDTGKNNGMSSNELVKRVTGMMRV